MLKTKCCVFLFHPRNEKIMKPARTSFPNRVNSENACHSKLWLDIFPAHSYAIINLLRRSIPTIISTLYLSVLKEFATPFSWLTFSGFLFVQHFYLRFVECFLCSLPLLLNSAEIAGWSWYQINRKQIFKHTYIHWLHSYGQAVTDREKLLEELENFLLLNTFSTK